MVIQYILEASVFLNTLAYIFKGEKKVGIRVFIVCLLCLTHTGYN